MVTLIAVLVLLITIVILMILVMPKFKIVQKLTDKYVEEADKIAEKKEKEVMSI